MAIEGTLNDTSIDTSASDTQTEPIRDANNLDAGEGKPERSLRDQIEDARAQVAEKAERTRDDQGRFAREKAAKEKADSTANATDAIVKPGVQAPQAQNAAATDPNAPAQPERPTLAPNAWSAAAKAAWVNADPVLKQEIARREADVHKEFTRQDTERNLGLQFKKAAEPYAALIQQEGGNPIKGFQNYLETARILRSGDPQTKVQLVRQMCQQFGIDLGLTQNTDPNLQHQQPQRQAIDPNTQRLYTRLSQLESVLNSQQANAQNREQTELQANIQAFASNPKHEHFEAVKPAMAALLQSGQAQSLEEAYDAALWMRPDIRSSLIANSMAEQQAKRVADAKAKADAARRAGGSISGSPGNGFRADPQAGNRSLREEIEASLASHRV